MQENGNVSQRPEGTFFPIAVMDYGTSAACTALMQPTPLQHFTGNCVPSAYEFWRNIRTLRSYRVFGPIRLIISGFHHSWTMSIRTRFDRP